MVSQRTVNQSANSPESLPKSIAAKMALIEVQAWFDTVGKLARQIGLRVKMHDRYRKSAIILKDGDRVGRLWLGYQGVVCFDYHWQRSNFQEATSIREALEAINDGGYIK